MKAGCKLDLGILYCFAYWIFCLTSSLIILVFTYVTIPPNYPPKNSFTIRHYKRLPCNSFFFSISKFHQRQISPCSFGIILMQIVSSEIHMQWWNLLPGKQQEKNTLCVSFFRLSQNLQHSIVNVDGNCPRNCVEISGNPSVLDQVKGFSVFRENIDE